MMKVLIYYNNLMNIHSSWPVSYWLPL